MKHFLALFTVLRSHEKKLKDIRQQNDKTGNFLTENEAHVRHNANVLTYKTLSSVEYFKQVVNRI